MRRPDDRFASARAWRGAATVRSAITLALAAALGAGGALIVQRAASRDRTSDATSVDALLDGRRVSIGRLTGGAPFAEYSGPVRPRMRGGEGNGSGGAVASPSRQANAGAAAVLAEGVERPTGASLQAVGVVRLAEGRYRLASATLERARERSPDNARIAADLAVALLEEAAAEDVPRLAARALAVADEAIALDPYVDEAWFTRAAALEHLWIGPAAVRAWHEYLARDEASPWATEARRRVCALERLADPSVRLEARGRFERAIAEGNSASITELAREFPSEARKIGLDRLVRDWPAAVLNGMGDESRRIEAELRAVAVALGDVQVDRFLLDASRSLSASRSDTERREVGEALATYDRGRQAFRSGEIRAASTIFSDASSRLAAIGFEPVASLAAFDLSRCEIYAREYDSVLRRLEGVRSEAERRGHRHLAAKAWWVSGYVHVVRFDVAPALAELDRALDGLEATGDVEGAAIVGLLLAETNHWYGFREEAWNHSRRALAALSRIGASSQSSIGFAGIGILAGAEGEPAVSRCLVDASLAAAATAGDSVGAATAFGLRAALHARRGDPDAASADLTASREALNRIGDPVIAERVGTEVRLVEAELDASRSPDAAVALLTSVLETYDGARDRVRTVHSLRLRAAANATRQNSEAARRDIAAAIDELAEQRRRLHGAERRAVLGRETRAVFEEGVALHLGVLGDPDGAFRLAERERTWELPGEQAPDLVSPGRVADTLRERETVLVVTGSAVALWVWAINRNGVKLVRADIAESRLLENIERFRRGVEHGELSELAQLSDPIVEALWRPVEADIPEDETVVIVGDASLRRLPFGALVDSRTGRFLIERNAFSMARSVAVIVTRRDPAMRSNGLVLAVGDPEFDAGRHAGLSRLPRASEEARSVASLYPGAKILVGSEATVEAVRAEAAQVDVFHYAGHAVVEHEGRREPALVMSGGALTGSEIARMHLDGVQLVVLAACGTSVGGDNTEGSEGSASIAEAFLDAGVEEVVASHWAVSDDATAELLVEFHRRLRGGYTAAFALKAAVLAVIGGPDGGGVSPRDWAAFSTSI